MLIFRSLDLKDYIKPLVDLFINVLHQLPKGSEYYGSTPSTPEFVITLHTRRHTCMYSMVNVNNTK
jgi:hypothetical protein